MHIMRACTNSHKHEDAQIYMSCMCMHAGHVVHARAYSCVFACAGDHDLASLIIYMPILRRLEISIGAMRARSLSRYRKVHTAMLKLPQTTRRDTKNASRLNSQMSETIHHDIDKNPHHAFKALGQGKRRGHNSSRPRANDSS